MDSGRCGEAFGEQARGPRLAVTGSFPERVRAERLTFDATVTVTNSTDRPVAGLAASQPDVYVTRAGAIVATPLPLDDVGLQLQLAPGAARAFSATGSLRRCSDEQPLPPGRYAVHAVLRFVAEGGGESAAVGGPWPLEVG